MLFFIFKVMYFFFLDIWEFYFLLEVLVVIFSMGLVGFGDKINDMDVFLMMMSCDGNGCFLKFLYLVIVIDK